MNHHAAHAQHAVESFHILNRSIQVLKNIDGGDTIKRSMHFCRKITCEEEERIPIIGEGWIDVTAVSF